MIEVNFDGLIGPSHHFGGLGVGNVASIASQNRPSNPKAAALEGLVKMRMVQMLTGQQWILPPPIRPNWRLLRGVAIADSKKDLLKRCHDEHPSLLSAAYSSAFMWAANAATVAPSCDTQDGSLRLIPANLVSSLHRGQEARERTKQLSVLLRSIPKGVVTKPLPSVTPLRDEGAANHMRLTGEKAIHLFVHGPDLPTGSSRFFARQSKLASQLVAAKLNLDQECVFFLQQSQAAIDAGVFHNDVIAMSHGNWMAYHEQAFDSAESTIDQIQSRVQSLNSSSIQLTCVSPSELTLDEAVRTYLFNSQIVSRADGRSVLLSPMQCADSQSVKNLIRSWIEDPKCPIAEVYYLSLGQSMANGGGPACLRLRVQLTQEQFRFLPISFQMSEAMDDQLLRIIKNRYPESVSLDDLARMDFARHIEAVSRSIQGLCVT
jgi:succinylarginine dihydrolase